MLPLIRAAGLALALAAPAAAQTVRETVAPPVARAIPNLPGKSLVAVHVTYPPGAASLPHRHAASAFIYARVLKGAVRSRVDDGPVETFRAGEGWFEAPGAHHAVSENASATEPAELLAIFVVDSAETALTVPDAH